MALSNPFAVSSGTEVLAQRTGEDVAGTLEGAPVVAYSPAYQARPVAPVADETDYRSGITRVDLDAPTAMPILISLDPPAVPRTDSCGSCSTTSPQPPRVPSLPPGMPTATVEPPGASGGGISRVDVPLVATVPADADAAATAANKRSAFWLLLGLVLASLLGED